MDPSGCTTQVVMCKSSLIWGCLKECELPLVGAASKPGMYERSLRSMRISPLFFTKFQPSKSCIHIGKPAFFLRSWKSPSPFRKGKIVPVAARQTARTCSKCVFHCCGDTGVMCACRVPMSNAAPMVPLIPSHIQKLLNKGRDPAMSRIFLMKSLKVMLLSRSPMCAQTALNKGSPTNVVMFLQGLD